MFARMRRCLCIAFSDETIKGTKEKGENFFFILTTFLCGSFR